MPNDVIDQIDANEPVVPGEGQGQGDKVTINKSELESLQRQVRELGESERTWAGIARGNAGRVAEPQVVEEDDELDSAQFMDDDAADIPADDNAEKMVADIASEGVRAISKRGFVTGKQAQEIAIEAAKAVTKEMIGREVSKRTTDTAIMEKFPELRDQNSELFKETAARFKEAVAIDPKSAKNPGALFLAAKAAKESLERKNPSRGRDDDFEDEQDRRTRVRSQDSRPSGRAEIDDDDMLGNEAKAVIAGMGISQDQFKTSRKELGISGARRRR